MLHKGLVARDRDAIFSHVEDCKRAVPAARSVGLSVIGRPSNSGGVEFIAQLCRHRQVILLGENDRKPDGRRPGRQGAELVSRRLETTWGRPVWVAFPPKNVKDLREWVRRLVPDWQTLNADSVRQTILDAVQPPILLLLARPCDKHGRAEIKVFRRDDCAEAAPVHADRLYVEEATARRRFIKAIAKAHRWQACPGIAGRRRRKQIESCEYAGVEDLAQAMLALSEAEGRHRPHLGRPDLSRRSL